MIIPYSHTSVRDTTYSFQHMIIIPYVYDQLSNIDYHSICIRHTAQFNIWLSVYDIQLSSTYDYLCRHTAQFDYHSLCDIQLSSTYDYHLCIDIQVQHMIIIPYVSWHTARIIIPYVYDIQLSSTSYTSVQHMIIIPYDTTHSSVYDYFLM